MRKPEFDPANSRRGFSRAIPASFAGVRFSVGVAVNVGSVSCDLDWPTSPSQRLGPLEQQ